MTPIETHFERDRATSDKMNGWLALSPIFVFLGVYLVTSIVVNDFYSVPITAAFVIATVYAMLITRRYEKLDRMLDIFSEGASNRNVLIMIWIFVLAGAFATTSKEMGAIDATVNFALWALPGNLIYAGLFFAACFISMAIGTSVGTIVALVPIAAGLSEQLGISAAFTTAIIVGGSFFGDNLSFISDTTIAATQTQGCSMRDKFRVNIMIAGPAAVIVGGIYVYIGLSSSAAVPEVDSIEWMKIVPYLLAIGLALGGMNVIGVLCVGVIANGVIGIAAGDFTWVSWLASVGNGIKEMGELIIVTMLAGGLLELIRYNGGLNFIIKALTRRVKGKRGAEFAVASLAALANLCTANNTIAILTTGPIARDISESYSLDSRKTASLLDTASCLVQGIIPYGAQLLMASTLAGVSAMSIIGGLYYPLTLGVVAIASILLRFPKKYS